jgi:MFS family permease
MPLPGRLKGLLGIFLLFALANSSDAFLLLRAKDLGVADAWLPVLWCLLSISKMTWSVLGGAWSDRMPRHRLVLCGWAIYVLTYGLLGFASSQWQVWVLFAFYGAFYGFTEPVEKALIRDLTPEPIRGRAFGAYNAMLGLSSVPAGLLTGALWQAYGAPTALWVGAAVALFAALLLGAWSAATPKAKALVSP